MTKDTSKIFRIAFISFWLDNNILKTHVRLIRVDSGYAPSRDLSLIIVRQKLFGDRENMVIK